MLKMTLQHYLFKYLSRHYILRNQKLVNTAHFVNQGRPFSSSSDSSDEENGAPKSKIENEKKDKTKTRMKDLLTSSIQVKMGKKFKSSSTPAEEVEKIKISAKSEEESKLKDKNKLQKINLFSKQNVKVDKKISGRKDEEIELNEQTKQRMKNLLLTFNQKTYSKEEEIKITQAQPRNETIEAEEQKKTEDIVFDFSVQKAVKEVADLFGGDKTKRAETESELLQSLQSATTPKHSLNEIISKMEVAKPEEVKPYLESKAPISKLYEFRSKTLPQRRSDENRFKKVDLFDAHPLNIFPKDFKSEGKESILSIWDSLNEREMKLATAQPPRNYFEEMINWTEEGKVWKFPIDNEIGLEEEKSYSFADHIFLEQHLSEWCPKKGPIRHFMELVCVGLSKNPHLTVNRKKAHIEWYKNYFDSKKDLLQDIGAM